MPIDCLLEIMHLLVPDCGFLFIPFECTFTLYTKSGEKGKIENRYWQSRSYEARSQQFEAKRANTALNWAFWIWCSCWCYYWSYGWLLARRRLTECRLEKGCGQQIHADCVGAWRPHHIYRPDSRFCGDNGSDARMSTQRWDSISAFTFLVHPGVPVTLCFNWFHHSTATAIQCMRCYRNHNRTEHESPI